MSQFSRLQNLIAQCDVRAPVSLPLLSDVQEQDTIIPLSDALLLNKDSPVVHEFHTFVVLCVRCSAVQQSLKCSHSGKLIQSKSVPNDL